MELAASSVWVAGSARLQFLVSCKAVDEGFQLPSAQIPTTLMNSAFWTAGPSKQVATLDFAVLHAQVSSPARDAGALLAKAVGTTLTHMLRSQPPGRLLH